MDGLRLNLLVGICIVFVEFLALYAFLTPGILAFVGPCHCNTLSIQRDAGCCGVGSHLAEDHCKRRHSGWLCTVLVLECTLLFLS